MRKGKKNWKFNEHTLSTFHDSCSHAARHSSERHQQNPYIEEHHDDSQNQNIPFRIHISVSTDPFCCWPMLHPADSQFVSLLLLQFTAQTSTLRVRSSAAHLFGGYKNQYMLLYHSLYVFRYLIFCERACSLHSTFFKCTFFKCLNYNEIDII